uniref:DUF3131 domain-containing protein n=1 Tax=Caldiarchaeum subterraneum TaxID=311458 RepID=A0A7C5YB07_CALS0
MYARPVLVLIVLLVLSSVQAQEIDVQLVKDVLGDDLRYARSIVTPDGRISPGFDPSGSLRGHALVGIMVAKIHLGLKDPESLVLLNRVAAAVNSRIESEDGVDLGFDSGFPEPENYFAHVFAVNFLSMHYGLTKYGRSRANMLKLGESLEKRFGWVPYLSKASFLVHASRISYVSGGTSVSDDLEMVLNDFTEHFVDIVDFSTKSFDGLTESLYHLSLLLNVVDKAGLTAPVELQALWAVHVDRMMNQTASLSKSPENYSRLIRTLTALTYAAENSDYTAGALAAEQAVAIAQAVSPMWRSGDRILYLPVSPLDVYPLDPLTSSEAVLNAVREGRLPMVADLRFPSLLMMLDGVKPLPPELKTDIALAVGKVALKNGVYPVVEKGIVQSDEFVNRFMRVNMLSEFLAIQYELTFRQRNMVAEIFFDIHPSFLVSLTALLVIAFMHRAGLLRW